MPDESTQVVARTSNQDLAMLPLPEAIEAYTPQFAEALPDHIPLHRFKRTVLTALNQNPDLAKANRRSFFLACVKCAQDGLYPDGREAALVVYAGAVQYLPMIAGIRKRMRNTKEVLSATAEVVYANDSFRYVKGEEPRIEHEPPPLDQDRGKPVGAYAIIKLVNGESLREVMGLHEIERVRAFSRNATGKNSPWETSWGEMARKTVLRRCSKSAPIGSDLDGLMARDDEVPEEQFSPPPPSRDQFRVIHQEPIDEITEPAHEYPVVDCDGQVVTYTTPGEAANNLSIAIAEALSRARRLDSEEERLGLFNTVVDNNGGVIRDLPDDLNRGLWDAIRSARTMLMNQIPTDPPRRRRGRPPNAPTQQPNSPRPAIPAANTPQPVRASQDAGGTPAEGASSSSIPEWVTADEPERKRAEAPAGEAVDAPGGSSEAETQLPDEADRQRSHPATLGQVNPAGDTGEAGGNPALERRVPRFETVTDGFLVPYDPTKYGTADKLSEWYQSAAARLRDMRKAQHGPDAYRNFRVINKEGLAAVHDQLKGWAAGLEKLIAAGEAGT